jgi:hypothetical protein
MVPRMTSTATETTPHEDLHGLARNIVTRAVVVIGLSGIALVHLLDSISKFSETPYVAWMYIALMLGSLGAAALLIVSRSKIGFAAAGTLAASAIAGYVLSRTTGLPNATGDIGNWTEPLGLAALFIEGCVLAVSAFALVGEPSPARARGITQFEGQTLSA